MKAKKTAAEINALILQRKQEAARKELFKKIVLAARVLGKTSGRDSKVLSIENCFFFYDPFFNFVTVHTQSSKSAPQVNVYHEERGKDFISVEVYLPGKWEQVLEKMYTLAVFSAKEKTSKAETNPLEETSEELRQRAALFGIKC